MTERRTTPPRDRRRRNGSAQASRRRAKGSGRRRKAPERRGKGRLWGGLGAMTVLGAAGFAAVAWVPGDKGELSADARPTASAEPTPERSRPTPGTGAGRAPGAGRDPSASPGTSPSGSPSGSPSPSPSPSERTIPQSGPGTFTKASGTGTKVGRGKALRYRVEVEKGLSLSAADVAEEVERVLGDPRGWTADGHSAFQRVSGGPTDFVVKVATPGTVDDICGAYGLDTRGDLNCNVGDNVMVNLERWELATPVYADDVKAYRALIINHEVGHFLGHGHVGCPGEGEPAPAMMQQIKGMNGCVPNVWPYDAKGRLITGPAVP